MSRPAQSSGGEEEHKVVNLPSRILASPSKRATKYSDALCYAEICRKAWATAK